MPLVMEGEEAPVGLLVLGDHHSAIPCAYGLEDVEAEAAGMACAPYGPSMVGGSKGLGAILDEKESMLIRYGPEFVQARRISQHVNGHDGPGSGGDLAPYVLRIQIERPVDLRKDRDRPGVHDRRDAGDKGVPWDNHLIARSHAQPAKRHQERGGPGIDRDRVLHSGKPGHCLLEIVDLRLKGGIVLAPVAKEVSRLDDLQKLPFLLFSDQLHTRSWHLRILLSMVTDVP